MQSLGIADILRKFGLEAFSLLGALIGLSFIDRLTIVAAIVALVAGFAFAVVAAPITVYYLDPPAEIRDYVLAGTAGLFSLVGFTACGAIHASAQHMREWLPGFIRRMIERKTGGG